MQSCCLFLPIIRKSFKFLKTCPYDFHNNLHSHSKPQGTPVCQKTSRSYGWDVKNIAKISPNWPKNSFSICSKTVHTIQKKFSTHQSRIVWFYNLSHSHMCNGIKIVWLGCEKLSKLAQKWSKYSHFSFFSKSVQTIRTKLCTVPLRHIMVVCV